MHGDAERHDPPWCANAVQGFDVVQTLDSVPMLADSLPASVPNSSRNETGLADAAGAAEDEHEIKLGEAALREYAVDQRPEFLAAADHGCPPPHQLPSPYHLTPRQRPSFDFFGSCTAPCSCRHPTVYHCSWNPIQRDAER